MGACNPLALTTTVNTLAVAIADGMDDDTLALAAAVLTQLGDTLGTIAAQRIACGQEK
jgi:Co/Zn/Cd efflux system component